MGIVKNIKLGLRSYVESVKFVVRHKMYGYFIAPVLVFGAIYYLGFRMEDNKIATEKAIETASWFMWVWGWIKFWFYAAMSVLFLQLTRYIMLMLMSPLLAITSEKVEKVITGNTYKLNLRQLWKDVRRAIRIAFRNLIYELVMIMILYCAIYMTFWMTGLNNTYIIADFTVGDILYGLTASLVAFYFYGFSFLDYVMERQRLSVRESVKFVRKHKGVAIALGSVFVLLFHSSRFAAHLDFGLLKTIFQWTTALLASTIPVFTAIAATLSMHELVDLSTNKYATRREILEASRDDDDPEVLPPDLPGEEEE